MAWRDPAQRSQRRRGTGRHAPLQLLSELKNAVRRRQGGEVAKNTGIGEQVADEALDPEGAKRLSDGVLKFNDVWKKGFEDRQARKAATLAQKATQALREKFRKEVAKVFRSH